MSLTINSSAFASNAAIPSLYTCEGKDVSPPLSWSGAPSATKSFALIVDDPDAPDPSAPKMTWVHWVLYDIPATAVGLPEAVKSAALPPGTREGINDWKRTGYGGPCPPQGDKPHRYIFTVYALKVDKIDADENSSAALVGFMINANRLDKASLTATYGRK